MDSLLRLAVDRNVPDHLRHLPMQIANSLVKRQGKHVRHFFPDALRILMGIATAQFTGGGWDSESDARWIFPKVQLYAERSKKSEFFTTVMQMLTTSADPGESFASVCVLIGIVDAMTNEVEENVENIINYAKNQLSTENPSVIGGVLYLFHILSESVSDALEPYAKHLLEIALVYSRSSTAEISKTALEVVRSILYNIELETSFILSLISVLTELFSGVAAAVRASVLKALAAAFNGAKSEARNFANDLCMRVWPLAQPDQTDCDLREGALEVLGQMVSFCFDSMGELFGPAVMLLLEESQNADRGIRWVCLNALTWIVKLKEERALPDLYMRLAMTSGIAAVGIQWGEDEDVREFGESGTCSAEIIARGFTLIRILIKRDADECAQFFGRDYYEGFYKWGIAFFTTWLGFADQGVACKAIRCFAQFTLAVLEHNLETDICSRLVNVIRLREEADVVGMCFRAFSKIVIRRPEFVAPHINEVLALACSGMRRELACQVRNCEHEDERFSYNLSLNPPIQDAIANAIRAYTLNFPISDVLSVFNSVADKVDDIEVCSLIGILADYADIGGQIPPQFVEYALWKLELCDFKMAPDPIFFARVLIRDQPHVIADQVPRLVAFFTQKLMEPASLCRYYWETITNIISAVLDLAISKELSGSLDLGQFIGPVLAKLPVRGDLREAVFIYETILTLASV
jgi:hypothetical protein